MMKSGLLSVTFRQLDPDTIIRLAARAGLEGIEWGGDVHAPPDRPSAAVTIGNRTRDAGLTVSAYGSYYRLGDPDPDAFKSVLETASALEAKIIRVWAGRKGSDKATDADRLSIAEDGRRVAELAQEAGLEIACEWHADTLTDTSESAAALFAEVGHSAFLTFWQPRSYRSVEFNLRDMEATLPRLTGLHVFHWDVQTRERLPLADGKDAWGAFLAKASVRGSIFASLEFVAGDDPERMIRDAATLKAWLAKL